MRLTITIDTENAAFEGRTLAEVCSILETIRDRWSGWDENDLDAVNTFPIHDSNGNRVGKCVVS